MFGDVALRLLKMRGHSGTVPSALLAEDVPAALVRLEAAVAADSSPPQPDLSEEGEDDEPVVSLSHRSIPLVELLKAVANAECDMMWESNT